MTLRAAIFAALLSLMLPRLMLLMLMPFAAMIKARVAPALPCRRYVAITPDDYFLPLPPHDISPLPRLPLPLMMPATLLAFAAPPPLLDYAAMLYFSLLPPAPC